MAQVTNTDIMRAILDLSEDVSNLKTDMTAVKEQVKYTNGKVANLMEDKIRRDERVKVAAEQQQAPAVQTKEGNVIIQPPASYWSAKEKLIGALVGLVTVISAAVALYTGAQR